MPIRKIAKMHCRAKAVSPKEVIGPVNQLRTRHGSYVKLASRTQRSEAQSAFIHQSTRIRKRPNMTMSSSVPKRPKRALVRNIDESPTVTNAAAPSTEESLHRSADVEREAVADDRNESTEAVHEQECAPVEAVPPIETTAASSDELDTSNEHSPPSFPDTAEAESDGNPPGHEPYVAENAEDEGEIWAEAVHSVTGDVHEATRKEAANPATNHACKQHDSSLDDQAWDGQLPNMDEVPYNGLIARRGESQPVGEASRSAAEPEPLSEGTTRPTRVPHALSRDPEPLHKATSHTRRAYSFNCTNLIRRNSIGSLRREASEPAHGMVGDQRGFKSPKTQHNNPIDTSVTPTSRTPLQGIGSKHQPIVIDDDSDSSQHSDMVNWTSSEYEEQSMAIFSSAWEDAQVQWAALRPMGRLLRIAGFKRFQGKMRRAYKHVEELHQLHLKEGRELCSQWKVFEEEAIRAVSTKEESELVRSFGRALVCLQEAEAENESLVVVMGDGDKNDDDYMPSGGYQNRRRRKR